MAYLMPGIKIIIQTKYNFPLIFKLYRRVIVLLSIQSNNGLLFIIVSTQLIDLTYILEMYQ